MRNRKLLLILFLLAQNVAVIAETSADSVGAIVSPAADSVSTPPVAATPPPQIKGTFMGVTVGLSIGAIPIFTMWQSTLPATLQDLGLAANFGGDLVPGDSAFLKYRVAQNPDEFNFVLPFSLSVNRISGDRAFSFALSFLQSSRRFRSELTVDDDDPTRKIDIFENMAFSSISVEAACQWPIPPMFFSIDGARQTFLLAGIGVAPLNFFARSNEIRNSAPEGDLRMAAIADSARARFSELSANGLGITWRAGINTLKSYRHGGGLEMGLFYSGSYSRGFYAGGENITQSRIDGVESENDKPLSFISNRMEFRITFLRSFRKTDRLQERVDPIDINELMPVEEEIEASVDEEINVDEKIETSVDEEINVTEEIEASVTEEEAGSADPEAADEQGQ